MNRISKVYWRHLTWVLLNLGAVSNAWAQQDAGVEVIPIEQPATSAAAPVAENLGIQFWGPRNTVSWSAFFYGSLSFPALNLEGERAFLRQLTAFFALGGWSYRFSSSNDGWSGWVEVGARFFPGAEAPRGFFLQAFAYATASNIMSAKGSETDSEGKMHSLVVYSQESSFGLGPLIGYTWIPWQRLVIRIGAGATGTRTGFYQQQYLEDDFPGKQKKFRFEFNHWTLLPVIRASVGYAF